MTQLLVSVRNAAEAELALREGVSLIDIKEPRRGSLGAADDQVITEVVARVGARAQVSVALGELTAVPDAQPSALSGAAYWKAGLADWGRNGEWREAWTNFAKRQPPDVSPVAVIYADWQNAAAPTPEDIIDFCASAPCGAFLVDTWRKDGRGLLDHWSIQETENFIRAAKDARRLSAVAGSLDLPAIRKLLPLQPDIIAVRGAACSEGRTGELCTKRVANLLRIVENC